MVRIRDLLKRFLWFLIKPLHPYIRNLLLFSHVIHHCGRQRYHVGYLKAGKTISALEKFLRRERFWPCRVAWSDDGEVLNLRRFNGFQHQYHLRIFRDGEVRGHYEKTPEAHPIDHMNEIGMEARSKDFLRFLDGWVAARSR